MDSSNKGFKLKFMSLFRKIELKSTYPKKKVSLAITDPRCEWHCKPKAFQLWNLLPACKDG